MGRKGQSGDNNNTNTIYGDRRYDVSSDNNTAAVPLNMNSAVTHHHHHHHQFDDGYSSYGSQHLQQQYLQQYGGPIQQQQQQQQQQNYGVDFTVVEGWNMDPSLHHHHQQQQQQQQPYYEGLSQQQHYYADPSSQQPYYDNMGGWHMMGGGDMAATQAWPSMEAQATAAAMTTAEKGSYYRESEFSHEVLYGHAVNALAYDPFYECIYLSGTTQSMSTARFNAHRASLLLTYTTPSPAAPISESFLYSSVAGHPEASPSTLQAVYQSIYGISKVSVTPPTMGTTRGRGQHYPPSHAYLPPYGGGELAENATAPHMMMSNNHAYSTQIGHVGITELLPLGDGFVASVSPSAVRIHSYGGLQLNDHNVEGMLCGTIHPHSGPGGTTHISVGGISMAAIAAAGLSSSSSTTPSKSTTMSHNKPLQNDHSNIHCLDLWQGLRPVYSRSLKDGSTTEPVGVTALATSHDRESIVAGCTDGNIRILDGSLRELATIKSHVGGVSSISISPDGLLIATTGYSSKAKPSSTGTTSTTTSNALYAFPDPKAYVYDIRYLGRGGISHPFAGVKGSPRFARFLPNIDGCASNRLLVASGKPGGGMQTMTPFEPQDNKTTQFLVPPLEQGESMSAISRPVDDGDEMGIGTSLGRVLRFRMAGYDSATSDIKTKHATMSSWSGRPEASTFTSSKATAPTSTKVQKLSLEIPSYFPSLPALSLVPTLLQGDPNLRTGTTEEMRSVFGTYTLLADPKITYIGNSPQDAAVSFGAIGATPIVADKRRTVAQSLLKEATIGEREFMLTIPTSKIGVDLLANHSVTSKRYKGKKIKDPIPNPNKTLYNSKISSSCYEEGFNERRKHHRGQRSDSGGSNTEMLEIPPRYQLQVRPGFNATGAFDPSDYNDTGLFPGWDYEPSTPNSWVCPVLLLFYFVPEIRAAALASQLNEKSLAKNSYDQALLPELGFVFDQMESLSRFGLLYPSRTGGGLQDQTYRPKIGAWVPSNLLSFISTMPEAEQLQVLDGCPAAVDRPRRPESFYRFLAYQFDKEFSSSESSTSSTSSPTLKLVDSLGGLDFLSSNQFIESKSSPPTQSVTRALTLELNYDMFPPGAEKRPIHFGELLQHSLCRETRLRAWNSKTRADETIVQRKIATSLPKMLTLSCACAGRKEEDGLWAWRRDQDNEPWLPDVVEVELLPDGNVEVTQWHQAADGSVESTSQFRSIASLPKEVSKMVSDASTKQKYRYRLDAVLSYVIDSGTEGVDEDDALGHHVLHARIPVEYKKSLLKLQAVEARKLASKKSQIDVDSSSLTHESEARNFVVSARVSANEYEKRAANVEAQLSVLDQDCSADEIFSTSEWILYNGFKVSKTFGEDARAFHVSFKEPVLVMFQAVDEHGAPLRENEYAASFGVNESATLPVSVMNPRSLSSVTNARSSDFFSSLHDGKPIAFDAEFVAVQEEVSTLTEVGQKLVLRDTRHALGRISLFDCGTQEILVDDHVLPREPVVDFLTRFSGIVADDLDSGKARHRIISTRSAYLQMRFLLQHGCIFVGHGLKQDFGIVNLVVPPHQILDTVEIFHQPGMRYISLRFLANYVLGRDMQQDTHDSVEDARASFELYRQALEWKKEGVWDQRLQEMYSYGDKTSWKIGVNENK